MTTPAAPKPDDTLASLLERVNRLEEATRALATAAGVIPTAAMFIQMGATIDALEARVTELEDQPPPEPDEYQARLTLNTASTADRPQALADLDRAVHLRATVEDVRSGAAVVPDDGQAITLFTDQAITLLTDLADDLESP